MRRMRLLIYLLYQYAIIIHDALLDHTSNAHINKEISLYTLVHVENELLRECNENFNGRIISFHVGVVDRIQINCHFM